MNDSLKNNGKEDSASKKEMTFFDHLEELRWHLVRAAVVLLSFTVLAFLFKSFIFDVVILSPKEPHFITNELLCQLGLLIEKSILCINQNELKIINITIAGQFLIHLKISLIAGFILAFPYLIYELWLFVSPALYHNEKKTASRSIIAISLLFFLGVMIGYFLIVPLSLNFLSNYSISDDVPNMISLTSYISNISSICFAAGILFELPVLAYFFSKISLLSPQLMKTYRKHAYVAVLILSAVLTPPDLISQVLIALPLFLLYEISIKISASVTKRIK